MLAAAPPQTPSTTTTPTIKVDAVQKMGAAVVIHGDTMPAERSAQLLERYLGRAPRSAETDALHLYGCLYRYLELLWYLALDRPVLDEASVTKKLSALRAML